MQTKTSKFSDELLRHFKADKGAYSKVTDVEAKKRQVLTRVVERDLFEEFFNEELAVRLGCPSSYKMAQVSARAKRDFSLINVG